jgi:hypothetical protein
MFTRDEIQEHIIEVTAHPRHEERRLAWEARQAHKMWARERDIAYIAAAVARPSVIVPCPHCARLLVHREGSSQGFHTGDARKTCGGARLA